MKATLPSGQLKKVTVPSGQLKKVTVPPGRDCASEPEDEDAEDAPALQDAVTVEAPADAAGPTEGGSSRSIFGNGWRPVPVTESTEGVTPLLYLAVAAQAAQRATGLTLRSSWLLCVVALLAYLYGRGYVVEGDKSMNTGALAAAGRWLFYLGDGNATNSGGGSEGGGAASTPCLSLGTDTGGRVCDGAPFVHLMGLMYDEAVLRPFIMPGRPPAAGPGVRWYGRDEALLYVTSRHHPPNYYHSVTDDFYALYWGLRRALRHPAYVPRAGDPVGATSSSAPGPRVFNVVEDNWGWEQAAQRLAARFHHVTYVQPADLHTQSNGSQLVCFRGAALGSPGITLQRNAASVYVGSRSWKAPINAATQRYDARAFASFFTHSLLLQTAASGANASSSSSSSSSGAGGGIVPQPPQLDTIVVLSRANTRALKDFDALLAAVRDVAGSFEVVVASFDHMDDAEVATLMQRSAVLIGVHGAGLANVVYMQPGTTLFEISPPAVPETLAYYASLTYALGMRHVVLPGLCGGAFNSEVQINVGTFKALLDIALQDYDARDPT